MPKIKFIINPEADYTPTEHGGSFPQWFKSANEKRVKNIAQQLKDPMAAIDFINPGAAVGGAVKFISRMDEVMRMMSPKMKMRGDQLVGYLKSKGVSPKEIQASGLLEKVGPTDVKQIGEFITLNPGRHRLHTREQNFPYDDITLQKGGADNPTYKVDITDIEGVRDNPAKTHFKMPVDDFGENIGWRRSHVKKINGEDTFILDEMQSDWAQAERQGQGVFKQKLKREVDELSPEQRADYDFLDSYNDKYEQYQDELFKYEDASVTKSEKPFDSPTYQNKMKEFYAMKDRRMDLLKRKYGEGADAATLEPMNKVQDLHERSQQMMIDDFPMNQETFYRNQIAAAIDDAEKLGIKRILIPMKREGEDLAGTAGVTRFYETLNKKILPDLRKKLEKQGYNLKLTNEIIPPGKSTFHPDAGEMIANNVSDNLGSEEFERILAWHPADMGRFESPFTVENINDVMAGNKGTRPEFAEHIRYAVDFLEKEVYENVAPGNVGHLIEILKIPSKPASLSTF